MLKEYSTCIHSLVILFVSLNLTAATEDLTYARGGTETDPE